MNRLLAILGLAGGLLAAAHAQTTPAFPFTYYIHDTTGAVADFPLPSIYQFTSTSLGSSSHIVVKVVNSSTAAAFMGDVLVTKSTTAFVLDPDFTVTGLAASIAVPAGGSLLFQINFSPTLTGPITAYLQTTYQVQQNGCDFTSTVPSTQCQGGVNASATLNGTATQPQLVLSYDGSSGTVLMQPSATPLNFGNVSVSASVIFTFTLANESTLAITVPSIAVPAPTVYSSSPFALDASHVPSTLAPGISANFTVTYAPGQTGVVTTSINVGSNTYPIQGAGIVVADIDALQIFYVDNTGVRTLPQAATPISFGQLVAGASITNVLTFTVTNPSTSYNAVAVSGIAVTGSGFAFGGLTGANAFPASIAPGASLGFTITFNGTASGNYTGTLAIGTRTFALSGLSVSSPLPSLSLAVNPLPLSSGLQATVAVQLAAVAALNLIGSITLGFSPSVLNVKDDPAIVFLGNNGRQLPISVTTGAQIATYKSQSALSFQTGTTAGDITFTVNFPNTAPYTQSYTITPAIVQISSATAAQSNPNIVLNIAGYDNTYSAANLNFTFYDTSGKAYPAIAYNAAGAFQNLFFSSTNTTGGAFALKATFPVTGDITKIASVAISISNSVGQANSTVTITQ